MRQINSGTQPAKHLETYIAYCIKCEFFNFKDRQK